ncbi:MAG: methyltransferase family protein [Myxococcota bacterium]
MYRRLYWALAHLGLMSFAAAFAMGFRHDPQAPLANVGFNVGLFTLFIAVHIVMMMPAFKRTFFGNPEGTPPERRLYVTIAVVTWVALYVLHKPVPGFGFASPLWLQFVGLCALLLSVVAFFEFATFESLAGLLGLPGAPLSHSVGAETPLMTEGAYAAVRHPMYRAACFLVLSSLLMHPHAGQLLFVALCAASFLGFIPVEERQLLSARGAEYRAYMDRTPSRVFKGIW